MRADRTRPPNGELDLPAVVFRLGPFVIRRAFAADHRQLHTRARHPAFLMHEAVETRCVVFRHLAGNLRGAAAVAAHELRATFHHCSPAPGKYGLMSTGMSPSRTITEFISGVALPHRVSNPSA